MWNCSKSYDSLALPVFLVGTSGTKLLMSRYTPILFVITAIRCHTSILLYWRSFLNNSSGTTRYIISR